MSSINAGRPTDASFTIDLDEVYELNGVELGEEVLLIYEGDEKMLTTGADSIIFISPGGTGTLVNDTTGETETFNAAGSTRLTLEEDGSLLVTLNGNNVGPDRSDQYDLVRLTGHFTVDPIVAIPDGNGQIDYVVDDFLF